MTYATLSAIAGEFRGAVAFSSTTEPTDSRVTTWLGEEGALINSYISFRYTLPITAGAAPESFELLKKLEIALVAWRVAKVRNQGMKSQVAGNVKVSQFNDLTMAYKQALDDLNKIKIGQIILRDATQLSNNAGIDSGAGNSPEAVFCRTIKQW